VASRSGAQPASEVDLAVAWVVVRAEPLPGASRPEGLMDSRIVPTTSASAAASIPAASGRRAALDHPVEIEVFRPLGAELRVLQAARPAGGALTSRSAHPGSPMPVGQLVAPVAAASLAAAAVAPVAMTLLAAGAGLGVPAP
jgi:hypothetical protein